MMSEFSVLTEESEINPMENILDLRISEVSFDNHKIIDKIFSLRESMASAIKTFVTVDFFINESKTTDMKEGYEP